MMEDLTVTIAGEPATIAEFSAFKALYAGELVAEVEGAWREIMKETAGFKRDFEGDNYDEFDRPAARYQFRPRALANTTREEDPETGAITIRETIATDSDGQPLIGPDPLASITEEDWAAADQKLRIHHSPSETIQWVTMAPTALKLARAHTLRLIALVLTSNRDLEGWDLNGDDIVGKLDADAKRLVHQAKADELVRLLAASVRVLRDQLADPFDEMVAELRSLRQPTTEIEEREATVEPMRVEDAAEPGNEPKQDSSTESAATTTGPPTSSSTASVGASSET